MVIGRNGNTGTVPSDSSNSWPEPRKIRGEPTD